MPLHRRYAHLTLALALGLAGCEPEGMGPMRYQVGDTTVMENVEPLVPDTLVPTETARTGRLDGPSESLVSEVYAFTAGLDGSVYLHDRGGGVRRFSPSGDYLERLARPGEGPGEVDYGISMDVSDDGRLAVYDLGNARVSLFGGADGPGGARRPDGRPRYREGGLLFTSDGSVWAAVHPGFPPSGAVTHPRPVYARLSDDGSWVDTVFTPGDAATECPELSEARHQGGFWEDQRAPFVPIVMWSMARDGALVVGCPARYAFDVRRPDGTVLRVTRAADPRYHADEERAFWARFGRGGAIPRERPAYAKLVPASDGRVWVWRPDPGYPEPLPAEEAELFGVTHAWRVAWQGTFDVFDPDGRWRAIVRLPEEALYSGFPTTPGIVVHGDTLWAVARDSLNVEYVVRYEVAGLDGAPGG